MADNVPEGTEQSGSELRQKLEGAIADRGTLVGVIAQQYGVDAAALKDVPADQIVTKAQEIQTANKAAEEAVVRKALGLGENDDLQAALAKVKGGGETTTTTTTEQPGSTPFVSTGSLGGTPPPIQPGAEGVRGPARIRAAMDQSN